MNYIEGEALRVALFRNVWDVWIRFIAISFMRHRLGGYSKGRELSQDSQDGKLNWLLKLEFLANLCTYINNFNKNLQGREENILTAKVNLPAK